MPLMFKVYGYWDHTLSLTGRCFWFRSETKRNRAMHAAKDKAGNTAKARIGIFAIERFAHEVDMAKVAA